MNRWLKTGADALLAGVFMGGVFTIQALPQLAPVRISGEFATVLVFVGAFVSGLLIGASSPSVRRGLLTGVISIVLGLAVAGGVLAFPAATGIAGQTEIVSVSIAGRLLVFTVVLAPVSVLGTFIGSFLA